LAPDVLVGLGASGTIHPVPLSPATAAGKLGNIHLTRFTVQDTDLHIAGGTGVKTGEIRIEGVHDGSLDLDGRKPRFLVLNVDRAVAPDIERTQPRAQS